MYLHSLHFCMKTKRNVLHLIGRIVQLKTLLPINKFQSSDESSSKFNFIQLQINLVLLKKFQRSKFAMNPLHEHALKVFFSIIIVDHRQEENIV